MIADNKTYYEEIADNPLAFKDILRELRVRQGKTQRDVARYLHYGCTAISNFELGIYEPGIRTLIQMADYFGVSLEYLIRKRVDTNQKYSMELEQLVKDYVSLNNDKKEFVQNIIMFILKDKPKQGLHKCSKKD